jgi:hypothetical protein
MAEYIAKGDNHFHSLVYREKSSSDFLFQRKIFVKNDDRLKKGILAETKRAHQLKGRCIFIDLDMGFPG